MYITFRRKIICFTVAVIVAITFNLSIIPHEVFASEITVTIFQKDDVYDIEERIQDALDYSAKSSIITVTGSKTNVDDSLYLSTSSPKTLIWKATYSSPHEIGDSLITIDGRDTNLYIPSGGNISSIGDDALLTNCKNIYIDGGTVTANGPDCVALSADDASIIMSNGAVKATGDNCIAIDAYRCSVTVNSGSVQATGNDCIALYTEYPLLISISGWIEASGNRCYAICADSNYEDINIKSWAAVRITGNDSFGILSDFGRINMEKNSKVTVKGDKSCAVLNDCGEIVLNGGTIATEGKYVLGISNNYGEIDVLSGSISSVGASGSAIKTASSTVRIIGGKLSVNGNNSAAIEILDDGIAAFIKGSCTGNMIVRNNKGHIVEVDSLNIPDNRTGNTGLVKRSGAGVAQWNMSSTKPKIDFILSPSIKKTMIWGDKKILVREVRTIKKYYINKGSSNVLPVAIVPENATNQKVTWKSKNPKIAKINPKTGEVYGKKKGKTIVTVTTADGNKTANCVVYVTKNMVALKGIKISMPKNKAMNVGKTYRVVATFKPYNASFNIPKFKSQNRSVAKIDNAGVITALKPGKTKITVTAGYTKKKKSFILTVK